jgi:Cu(I)/Ag(I) efflux system membrane fusion protein
MGDRSEADTDSAMEEQEESFYICPMHPSVRSDRPGACPVCGMALVNRTNRRVDDSASQVVAGENLASLQAVSLSPAQRIIANISVSRARRQAVTREIHAVGVVSYAEPNYRRISMRFPGRLERLYLSYTGQTVRKGDPVADVYSPEAISAQQEFLLSLDSHEQSLLRQERAGRKETEGERMVALSSAQMLEQSKQKLRHWGFTEAQIARLRETRQPEFIVTVYSAVAGIVVKKNVDPQHYAATGEDMFDVADLSTVWIYLDVYEKDIRFIRQGQTVQITTDAYPAKGFEGRVTFVDPVVDPESRTVRVRAEFLNPDGWLKPNMFVEATIGISEGSALVVPASAVLSTGRRTVVWVEVKENTFEHRDVVVGSTSRGSTVIVHGLEEGVTVAETGGFLIDSESALQRPATPDPHAGHSMEEDR